MRRLALTAMFMSFVGNAVAADMAVKAPIAPPAAMPSWTGFDVGVSVGGRWSTVDWTTTTPDPRSLIPPAAGFDSSTARAGGYLGYNWQVSPNWVLGIEGDVAWGNSSRTSAGFPGQCAFTGCGAFDTLQVKQTWDASIRERLGYLLTPNWLVYVNGGGAWQQLEINANCAGTPINASFCGIVAGVSKSKTQFGWTIGGGVETLIWDHWLARIEYRYADFGSTGFAFPAAPVQTWNANVNVKTNTVLSGLAYRF